MSEKPEALSTIPETAVNNWTEQIAIHEELLPTIQVTDAKTAQEAADRLKECRELRQTIDGARKDAVAPLRELQAQINELANPLIARCKKVEAEYKNRAADYHEKVQREHEEAERKKREEAEAARKRAEAKEEAGDIDGAIADLERADDKDAEAAANRQEAQRKTVGTGYGKVTITYYYEYEVVNAAEIPREYLTVDEKKLKIMAKLGADAPQIPGTKLHKHRRTSGR